MTKRMLTSLLVLALVFSTVFPAYASTNEPMPINTPAPGINGGAVGFEEAGIELDSSEMVSVIVMLKHNPAPVEQAIAATEGIMGISSVAMENAAANDKAVFYAGLDALFAPQMGMFSTESAGSYDITFDFDTVINGVTMTLPANKVEELLNIESVAAVFYNEEFVMDVMPSTDEDFDLGDIDAMGSDFAGTLNKISSIAMEIPEAHAKGYKGKNVIVGVIDTGVDYFHPDLKEAYFWFETMDEVPDRWKDRVKEVTGPDGVEGKRYVYYGFNGYDAQFAPYTLTNHPFPLIAKDKYDPQETTWFDWKDSGYPWNAQGNTSAFSNNHGTHVSGTIVARGQGLLPHNAVGVAPEANLINYRLGGPGGTGNAAAAVMCIEEGVKDGVDVFNYSFGSAFNPGPFTPLALAINNATLAYNIVFAHSAGNSGPYAYSIGGPGGAPLSFDSGNSSYLGINVILGIGSKSYAANLFRSNRATDFVPQLNVATWTIDSWILSGGNNIKANTVNADLSHNFYIMPQRDGGPGFAGIGTGVAADWTDEVVAAAEGKIVVVARGTESINTIPTQAATSGAAALVIINTDSTANLYDWGNNNNSMTVNYVPTFTFTHSEGLEFVADLVTNDMKAMFLDFNGTDRGSLSNSSSRGPVNWTFDIKPEITTPSSNIQSTVPWYQGLNANSNAATAATRDRSPENYAANGYGNMSGTSMASPFTAGLIALVIGQNLAEVGGSNSAGLGPNPNKMSALEVRARLANTANRDWFANKNWGVHEVGSGSPHVNAAIESDVFVTVVKEDIPVPTSSTFMEKEWAYTTSEVTSFSFGSANIGVAKSKTLLANVYNTSLAPKTFALSYEWNTTSNHVEQRVYSNGNVPIELSKDFVTIPAGGIEHFEATMTVPATLEALGNTGSHEGYVILTNTDGSGERYHLPFAITVLDTIPDWYTDGQATNSFNIVEPQDLEQLARIVSGFYGFRDSFAGKTITLQADLDLGVYSSTVSSRVYPNGWNPIGIFEFPFEGTFDGNGYTLSNLKSTANPNHKGLFGHVRNATLKNITVTSEDEWLTAQYGGGIVGAVTTTAGNQTTIENCVNYMNIRATGLQSWNMQVGGIVGYAETEAGGSLVIKDCTNFGNIHAATFIGGILGGTPVNPAEMVGTAAPGPIQGTSAGNILITNSKNYGDIRSSIDLGRLGGIAGYLASDGAGVATIENSVNYGSISIFNPLSTVSLGAYYPGYGNYSPESEYFNALGGVVGYAIGANIVDSSNEGLVMNNSPILLERLGEYGLPQGAEVKVISGGIVARAENTRIDNALNAQLISVAIPDEGTSVSASYWGGGIAGVANGSTISNALSTANVNAPDTAKAIVALAVDSSLEGNYRSGSVLLNGVASTVNDHTSPDGALGDALIVTFPGIRGARVEYYDTSWKTLAEDVSDGGSYYVPNGKYTVRVRTSGMSYTFNNVVVAGESVLLEAPVKTITITGVSSACSLAIVQSDWVYRMSPATEGVPNVFTVFDNGNDYEVRVGREGYSNLSLPGHKAGAEVWLDVFYNVIVPDGITNIRISNANWVDTTVWFANYLNANVITLMKNHGNAKLHYTQNGVNHVVDFVLDGSNPFPAPIIDDHTAEYEEYMQAVKMWNNIYGWATNGNAPFGDEIPNIYTAESVQAANAVLNNLGGSVGGAHAQAIRDENGGVAGPPYWVSKEHTDMLYWHGEVTYIVNQAIAMLVVEVHQEISDAEYQEYVRSVKLWNNILAWAAGQDAPFADVPNTYSFVSVIAANAVLNYTGGSIGGAHAQAIRDENGGQAAPPYWLTQEHADILDWYQSITDIVSTAESFLR